MKTSTATRLDGKYSATQIEHVYRHKLKTINEILSKKTIEIGRAFGNYQIDVKRYFSTTGNEDLLYKYVGYGGVNFMGNIEGKSVNGLYYKSKEVKKEIESLIIGLDILHDDVQGAIEEIHKQHGRPTPDHATIWYKVTH